MKTGNPLRTSTGRGRFLDKRLLFVGRSIRNVSVCVNDKDGPWCLLDWAHCKLRYAAPGFLDS